MKHFRNYGFTLTEMAIVITIVGLLVAGVTVGVSLKENAKTLNIIKEMESYKSAVNTFYDTYGALPGDFPNGYDHWGDQCVTHPGIAEECNGNGDGRLQNPADDGYNLEQLRAWQHLALAGMIPGTYTGIGVGNPFPINVNPLSSAQEDIAYDLVTPYPGWGGGGCFPDCNTVWTSVPGGIRLNKVYLTFAQLHPSPNNWGPLVPAEVEKIDRKMDDGLPQQGKIVVNRGSCVTGSGVTAQYNLTSTAKCKPLLDLGFSPL